MRLLVLALVSASAAMAADISGTWELIVRGGQVVDANRIQIALTDGKYVFKASGSEFRGTPDGERFRFECLDGTRHCGAFIVSATGDTMSGTGDVDGIAMEWTARRPPPHPASPTRHEFRPTAFYRQF